MADSDRASSRLQHSWYYCTGCRFDVWTRAGDSRIFGTESPPHADWCLVPLAKEAEKATHDR